MTPLQHVAAAQQSRIWGGAPTSMVSPFVQVNMKPASVPNQTSYHFLSPPSLGHPQSVQYPATQKPGNNQHIFQPSYLINPPRNVVVAPIGQILSATPSSGVHGQADGPQRMAQEGSVYTQRSTDVPNVSNTAKVPSKPVALGTKNSELKAQGMFDPFTDALPPNPSKMEAIHSSSRV